MADFKLSDIYGETDSDENIDAKDDDELPDMFLELLDKVRSYQGEIFLEETANMSIDDLNAKIDELEKEIERVDDEIEEAKEMNKLEMSKEEIISNLHKAFKNAIKTENYEAAAFLKKRIEYLKS